MLRPKHLIENNASCIYNGDTTNLERKIIMKNYELIIERRQPPCGGKQTKLYDFQNVETDDPVAYVRAHEQDVSDDMEVDRSKDGVVCIQFTRGIQPVRYEFTEI